MFISDMHFVFCDATPKLDAITSERYTPELPPITVELRIWSLNPPASLSELDSSI